VRVLILNRFFWPDESATAMLAGDVAEHLTQAGHEVHAVCARGLYRPGRQRLEPRSERAGVTIHRLWSAGMAGQSIPHRALAFTTFHLGLRVRAGRLPRPDAVFVMSDPPLVLGAALALKRRHGCRVLHFAADLYPDVAVAIGTLGPRSPLTRWMMGRARAWLASCDRVLALGPNMAEALKQRGVPAERVVVTPPWVDARKLGNGPSATDGVRRELGIPEQAVLVMYSGNMGRCHPHQTILGAVRALAGDPRVHWLFAGGGVNRERLEQTARREGLERVRLCPPQPRQRLGQWLAAGDVHLISQDPRTVGLVVPSKLAAAMAVGRPVVLVGPQQSDVGEAIRRHDCGRVVEQGDVEGLASTLRDLAEDQALRHQLGQRAAAGFRQEFSSEIVLERIQRVVEDAE
jgi:glycosyltransferase involved in cell wall biosynthesis